MFVVEKRLKFEVQKNFRGKLLKFKNFKVKKRKFRGEIELKRVCVKKYRLKMGAKMVLVGVFSVRKGSCGAGKKVMG